MDFLPWKREIIKFPVTSRQAGTVLATRSLQPETRTAPPLVRRGCSGKKELLPLFDDLMSKKFNFGDFVGHTATGDIDGYLVADFVAQKGLAHG